MFIGYLYIMRKYIFTEEQIKKVIDGMINEQAESNRFTIPATSNKFTIPSGTTTTKAWEGLKARLKSAYYYTEEDPYRLTYDFDKKVTMLITYTLSEANPDVGTMTMEIKFNDPNIIKQNGTNIAKIQSLLGAKLVNNAIIANRPQGHLTQNINTVANMLFNVIKINGKTMANTPWGTIVDKGEISGSDFKTN